MIFLENFEIFRRNVESYEFVRNYWSIATINQYIAIWEGGGLVAIILITDIKVSQFILV